MKVNSVMYQVYTNRSVSSQKVQNSMPPKMVQTNNVTQNVVPVSNIPLGAYNINFGYHSVLKDLFREDKLPTVKYGLYGDKLTKDNVSLEHLVPHSKNGKSKLFNFTLASKQKNSLRSNEDIRKFLTPEMAKEYLDQFKGIETVSKKGTKFNGDNYIDMIKTTLKTLGVDVDSAVKNLK